MKNRDGMIITAVLAVCLALAAIFGGGCGGDDTSCMATENCPDDTDAGMMTADADPMAPDADTTPDTNSDLCAEYRWMAEKPWDCPAFGGISQCDMELFTTGGICSVQCHDHFWLEADQLTISNDPPPPSLTYYIDGEPVTCRQHL